MLAELLGGDCTEPGPETKNGKGQSNTLCSVSLKKNKYQWDPDFQDLLQWPGDTMFI